MKQGRCLAYRKGEQESVYVNCQFNKNMITIFKEFFLKSYEWLASAGIGQGSCHAGSVRGKIYDNNNI